MKDASEREFWQTTLRAMRSTGELYRQDASPPVRAQGEELLQFAQQLQARVGLSRVESGMPTKPELMSAQVSASNRLHAFWKSLNHRERDLDPEVLKTLCDWNVPRIFDREANGAEPSEFRLPIDPEAFPAERAIQLEQKELVAIISSLEGCMRQLP